MTVFNKKFGISLILAITAHVVVLTVVFMNFHKTRKIQFVQNPNIQAKANENKIKADKPIIKSTLVDNKAVEQALARQKQAEINRKKQIAKELNQLKQIKQQNQKQQQEQAKIAKAKERLLKEKEQTAKDKAKLEQQLAKAAKDKQKVEQEKARALKEKNNAIAQKNKALAEQKKILEAKKKAEASEKNKLWIENEVSRYQEIFRQDIENNRTLSTVFANNLTATFRLKLLPDGNILSLQIQKSSGNIAYDSQQEQAIYKSAPFAMPQDPEILRRVRDVILSLSNDLSRIS